MFSPLSDAIKISVADLLGNLEKCVGVSSEKMNDYSRAFESYVAYLQDKNECPIVEEKIKGVLSPHALVGKSKYTDNLKFK